MRYSTLLAAVSVSALSCQAIASETTTFQYDAQGRLIQSSRSGGPADGVVKVTSFDFAGNRTNQTVTGASSGPSPPPPPPPPSNNPPVANTDYGSMQVCSFKTFDVSGNDTDPDGDLPLSVIAVSGPLSPTIAGTTSVSVTSGGGTGGNSITYTIQDSRGATANGILSVNVSGGICA